MREIRSIVACWAEVLIVALINVISSTRDKIVLPAIRGYSVPLVTLDQYIGSSSGRRARSDRVAPPPQ